MTNLSRRFLPSMGVLCAFEAAARLHSFTAAAAELALTQSAVSRQIRALEEMLDAELFVRERQTVRLNRAGQAYAREVREALQRISNATLGFRVNPEGGVLNVAILPTFGSRWLAPRLPAFLAAHPGITLNLTTRLTQFDFQFESLDAAIHFGEPLWPGAQLDPLMSEQVVPACSPAMRDAHGFDTPTALLKAPLLHLDSRPEAWPQWFKAMGVQTPYIAGMRMDQFALVAQAAIAGLGVALLPLFLIQAELQRGDLVLAIDAPVESPQKYYLAWQPTMAGYPPLEAFRDWLRRECRTGSAA